MHLHCKGSAFIIFKIKKLKLNLNSIWGNFVVNVIAKIG